jgi:hypothetical protein
MSPYVSNGVLRPYLDPPIYYTKQKWLWKKTIVVKNDWNDIFNIKRQNEATRRAWKKLLASKKRQSPIAHHVSRNLTMMEQDY